MKNLIIFALLFGFVFSFSGCKQDESKNTETEKTTVKKQNFQTSEGDNLKIQGVSSTEEKNKPKDDINIDISKRMIVRTGSMNLETENYDITEKKITETLNKHSGYIENSSSSVNSSGKKQGVMTIKVPADKYDVLLSEITTFGKVVSMNTKATDITEEYIDLEARQKTQKELEQRLLKLLSEKTARLTDVVEVEEKLASVRKNIESIDGRLRYLKSQTSYSTLTISIFEPSLLETSSGGGFFYEIGQGIKKGIRGFTEILSGIIMLIIALLPVIIIIITIYLIIRRIIRKKKKQV